MILLMLSPKNILRITSSTLFGIIFFRDYLKIKFSESIDTNFVSKLPSSWNLSSMPWPMNVTNVTKIVTAFIETNFIDRVPQFWETHDGTYPMSGFKDLTGATHLSFGKDPTLTTVYRDIPKATSNTISALKKRKVGNTGDEYGIGNVISGIVKPVCKVTIISLSTYMKWHYVRRNLQDAALGAYISNYVCEFLARMPVVIEKDLQAYKRRQSPSITNSSNTTNSSNLDLESFVAFTIAGAVNPKTATTWLSRSLMVIPSKVGVADSFSTMIWVPSGMADAIKEVAGFPSSSFLALLGKQIPEMKQLGKGQKGFALSFYDRGIYNQGEALGIQRFPVRVLITILLFIPQFAAHYVEDLLTSIHLMTVVRIPMDFLDSLSKNVTEYCLDASTIETGTTMSGLLTTHYCLYAPAPYKYACFPLGFAAKVALDETYNSGYTTAIDQMFGSGIKLGITFSGAFAIPYCMNLPQPAKSVCISTMPALVYALNAHESVETEIVNALYNLADAAQNGITAAKALIFSDQPMDNTQTEVVGDLPHIDL
jgi:hypothetical protein